MPQAVAAEKSESKIAPLRAGIYQATLDSIEERTTMMPNNQGVLQESTYWLWKFAITQPGFDTVETDEGTQQRYVWSTSSNKLTSGAKARPWVAALSGVDDLTDGVQYNTDDILGNECILTVTVTKDKKGELRNTVEAVSPPMGMAPQPTRLNPNGTGAPPTPPAATQAVQEHYAGPPPTSLNKVARLREYGNAVNSLVETGVPKPVVLERVHALSDGEGKFETQSEETQAEIIKWLGDWRDDRLVNAKEEERAYDEAGELKF